MPNPVMRRAAGVGLLLAAALAAQGQEPGAPAAPDPADLLRQALGRGEAAAEAAAALRSLPREALAPIADETLRRLDKAREATLAARKERIAACHSTLGGTVEKELKAARRAARDLVMSSKYTKERQPEVDRLVAEVRRLFYSPYPPEALEGPRVREERGRWSLLRDLAARARDENAAGEDPDAAIANCDREEIPRAWISPSQERDLADLAEHREFLDPEEYACLSATNRYRVMMGMGLSACRVDRKLVIAARKHSEEMQRLGYFAHESPVADHRTAGQRAGKEGTSCSSENIAAGQSRGEGAFDGWYRSPGHHRNILGSHGRTGVGRHGTLWTQMFG